MWVLHTQSCHFAAGLMPSPVAPGSLRDDCLHMLACVKTVQPVINGDVPLISTFPLYSTLAPHQLPTQTTNAEEMRPQQEIASTNQKLSNYNTTIHS